VLATSNLYFEADLVIIITLNWWVFWLCARHDWTNDL